MTRGGRERGHRGRPRERACDEALGPEERRTQTRRWSPAHGRAPRLGTRWPPPQKFIRPEDGRGAGLTAGPTLAAGTLDPVRTSAPGTRHPLGARAAPLPPRSGPRLYREVLQTPNLPPPGQETFRSRPPCVYKAVFSPRSSRRRRHTLFVALFLVTKTHLGPEQP